MKLPPYGAYPAFWNNREEFGWVGHLVKVGLENLYERLGLDEKPDISQVAFRVKDRLVKYNWRGWLPLSALWVGDGAPEKSDNFLLFELFNPPLMSVSDIIHSNGYTFFIRLNMPTLGKVVLGIRVIIRRPYFVGCNLPAWSCVGVTFPGGRFTFFISPQPDKRFPENNAPAATNKFMNDFSLSLLVSKLTKIEKFHNFPIRISGSNSITINLRGNRQFLIRTHFPGTRLTLLDSAGSQVSFGNFKELLGFLKNFSVLYADGA